MTFWDWLWAWTRDPIVWDWVRTTGAALIGALIGGLFTLGGQRQSMLIQSSRDKAAWVRTQDASRYDRSREDARKLFEDFAMLAREIQNKGETWAQLQGDETWADDWKSIWTTNRSLAFDVRARLLPDPDVRSAILELLDFLDSAPNLSTDDGHPSPGLKVGVRTVVQLATAESIDVMSGFLRGDPYATTRAESLDVLRQASKLYSEWEDHMIASSDAAAENWAREQEAMSDEEKPESAEQPRLGEV
ncbi:hypothetical protein OYT00_11190 [Microbacterium paraoxydans]|uniref:hypothetical protein n=1 Tax=Microbacterium paraoxydans TaxID=199592 RepID=UPI002285D7F8|nr:hypothetical protein [Microbacterium paraoxydans]MCZ0710565.1 hypothetical protein [Microbacterium paraoxydans]